MSAIKLERRYPESRPGDITDAYMRGVEFGMASAQAGSGGTQMMNAIPFEDWIEKQGDDVRIAMCEGHPETLILVDTTDFAVYKYVPAKNQDDAREAMSELLSKIGPSNAAREFVQHEVQDILDKPLDFKTTLASKFKAQDAQLQERMRHELLMTSGIIHDERFICRMQELGIEVD